jgi:hypothetical protein
MTQLPFLDKKILKAFSYFHKGLLYYYFLFHHLKLAFFLKKKRLYDFFYFYFNRVISIS